MKNPVMSDAKAGRIALKLLILKMAEDKESLRYITREEVRKRAKLFGITTKEMVGFVEKLYGEILAKMFADLKEE